MAGHSAKTHSPLTAIADILATGILRLHLRDVRNLMKKNGKSESGLLCDGRSYVALTR